LIEENDIYNLEKGTCINELITQRQVKYLISCIIGRVISDAVTEIKKNMKALKCRELEAKYPLKVEIATEECVLKNNQLFQSLKKIENNYVINNYKIHRMNGKSSFVLRQIIKAYLTNPKQLPDSVLEKYTDVCSIPCLKEKINEIGSTPKNVRYLNESDFSRYKDCIIADKGFLRLISDYIASMTDLYAINEYQKLYGGESI